MTRCRWNNQNLKTVHGPLTASTPKTNVKASYLMICSLNSGLPPSEANNEAPRPEIHSYSAAEAPGPLCLAPPATPPPPGASRPPRGRWQRPSAMGSGLGRPMPQRSVECLKCRRFVVGLGWISQSLHLRDFKFFTSHANRTN